MPLEYSVIESRVLMTRKKLYSKEMLGYFSCHVFKPIKFLAPIRIFGVDNFTLHRRHAVDWPHYYLAKRSTNFNWATIRFRQRPLFCEK